MIADLIFIFWFLFGIMGLVVFCCGRFIIGGIIMVMAFRLGGS